MKLVLLFSFFVMSTLTLNAQKYAYSFEGTLTASQFQELEAEILNLKLVNSCKIKIKDASKGEIFIEVVQTNVRAEGSDQFSSVDVKKILIEKGLMPLYFIELK